MIRCSATVLLASCLWGAATGRGGELWCGAASVSITPDQPVALSGQFHLRIARQVESPVTANVLVLETRGDSSQANAVVLISCDLVSIPEVVGRRVSEAIHGQLPAIGKDRVVLFATHTHTAPVVREGKYSLPEQEVLQVSQYVDLLVDRIVRATKEAWARRGPGTVSWGLGHAAVAQNRRAVYADGHAQMYGRTNVANFRGFEGPEDHDVNVLACWSKSGELQALLVNIGCTAQEVEGRSAVNADFWHPIREQLGKRYGPQLVVLGCVAAAGDQSPHVQYRKAAEERMRTLRGLTRLEELARRVVRSVVDVVTVIQQDQHAEVPLVHRRTQMSLPMREVMPDDYAEAVREVRSAQEAISKNPRAANQRFRKMKWYEGVVDRYQQQQRESHPLYPVTIDVVRIGDVVLCTNPFELFTEYGLRIKARSPAVQSFVIQLAGPGTYLPTRRAVQGGHYSAVAASNLVGPEGGQRLVDASVTAIEEVWQSSQGK